MIINLSEAKRQLSNLVDRAAGGEEIIIAKNGVPRATLSPAPHATGVRKPVNVLKVSFIAEDFDAPDPIVEAWFGLRKPTAT